MNSSDLRALAKPICAAVGVEEEVDRVMSIVLTPQEVYVEYMQHGQRKTVTQPVDYDRPEPS